MSNSQDLICFQLPSWLAIGQAAAPIAEHTQEIAHAADTVNTSVSSVSESGSSSLFGLLTTFMLGWQASSYGLAEAFTRLSSALKGKSKAWSDLATILWGIGIFFGKLGFGQPILEKRKIRDEAERKAKKKAVQKANVDRDIDPSDLGRYVRFSKGVHKGIGVLVNFDHPKKLVQVKSMMTDEKYAVDMRSISFVSDEEDKN